MSGRFQHFKVKTGSLFKPLRFQKFVLSGKFFQLFAQFLFDVDNGLRDCRPGRYIMVGRIDDDVFEFGRTFSGKGIKFINAFNFVAEKRYSPCTVFIVGRKDVQGVALNTKC